MTSKILEMSQDIVNKYSHYPVPVEPDWGGTFSFPLDADTLDDIELDTWMLRLGAWRGYVSSNLSDLEGQISVIEPAFELKVGVAMSTVQLPPDRRSVKEIVRSLAIESNVELSELQREVFIIKGEIKLLRGKLDFYESQFGTISRVVSRRGQDRVRI
jgi:hypothetical protein